MSGRLVFMCPLLLELICISILFWIIQYFNIFFWADHFVFPPQSHNPKLLKITANYNPGQKSLGQYCNMHIFLSLLGFLVKQCFIFENFLQFSLPPPYTKLKLGKNSGYARSTLFVGWGEELDLCELENGPESVPTLLSMIVALVRH